MFFLSRHYSEGLVLISDISREEHIPRKFLELILLDLKKQGLVKSKMGKGGGYSLARDPEDIYIGQIVRILEGPLAPIPCVSKTAYAECDECINEKTCEIRKMMMQVRDATAAILDQTSLLTAQTASYRLEKIM